MKSEDVFEKGLYWAFYQYLEDELIEYMRKVPYIDEHKHVHSPALLAQLLLSCSYIDTAFKDMARYVTSSSKSNHGIGQNDKNDYKQNNMIDRNRRRKKSV